jgi:hypothetical protein
MPIETFQVTGIVNCIPECDLQVLLSFPDLAAELFFDLHAVPLEL